MRGLLAVATVCALIALCAGVLSAQPLNGVYTCAAGNPGNAFDYADIGDFFDDLEEFGISGPVTLDVYDDGGPFASGPSYWLGIGFPHSPANMIGVPGVSSLNPLTLRAAHGERPEIVGATGASHWLDQVNPTLGIYHVSFISIEGLTLRDGVSGGIHWTAQINPSVPHYPLQPTDHSNIRISGCRFHDYSGMTQDLVGMGANPPPPCTQVISASAIYIGPDRMFSPIGSLNHSGPDFVIIENNMVWDMRFPPPPYNYPPVFRSVCAVHGTTGLEWIVRHNTLHQFLPFTASAGPLQDFVHAFSSYPVPFEQFHSNVVEFAGPGTSTARALSYAPLFADFNVYFGCDDQFPNATAFTQWQALGYDLGGIVADPLLVNTAPGFEDLHLQPNSPARNRSPINSVLVDIEGEPRPYGPARDAGADEWNPGGIELEFAGLPVAGAVDIGGIPLNGATRTFRINSVGPGHLRLTGNPLVELAPLANCDPSTGVQTQPAVTFLRVPGSTDFMVRVQPATAAAFSLTLSIASNALNSPLVITVTGHGLPPNAPAVANLAAGSAFAGPQNGPFNLTLQPGAPVVDATLLLTDPDSDHIFVLSVTMQGTPPLGIFPPQVSIPMHPRVLTWSGTTGTTPPGVYTWRVAFRDSVNASVITIDCIITIADLPPTHVIAAAFGGDGSAGNAYQAAFNRGDDAAAGIDLCTVSDPNTGQALTLAGATKIAGPGTVGFDFTLTAGTLRVSPAATLTFTEQGLHQYEAEVSDGLNTVSIFVSINVTGAAINFTNPSQLPTATVGEAVSLQLSVTGAIGPATFTITTGQLPDGLNMDTAGQITGTPTKAETATFTVEAEDTTGATGTRAFTMETTNPPTPPAPNEQDTGSGGCTAGASASALWALLALPALTRRRRR